jgi:hypothetical protein
MSPQQCGDKFGYWGTCQTFSRVPSPDKTDLSEKSLSEYYNVQTLLGNSHVSSQLIRQTVGRSLSLHFGFKMQSLCSSLPRLKPRAWNVAKTSHLVLKAIANFPISF